MITKLFFVNLKKIFSSSSLQMMYYISWEIKVGSGVVLPGLNPACAMSSWASYVTSVSSPANYGV